MINDSNVTEPPPFHLALLTFDDDISIYTPNSETEPHKAFNVII